MPPTMPTSWPNTSITSTVATPPAAAQKHVNPSGNPSSRPVTSEHPAQSTGPTT